MIKKLLFIDFDATLADSPLPDIGRKIWEKKTGQEYPHIGWWSKKESLDNKIFDIKIFDSLKEVLNKGNMDQSTVTILLTSRLPKLLPEILTILEANNIHFDHYSLKDNDKEKDVRIKEFIQKYPTTQTIDIYDDRDKEFIVFNKLTSEIGDIIEINIFKCTDGTITPYNSVGINEISKIIKEEVAKFIIVNK